MGMVWTSDPDVPVTLTVTLLAVVPEEPAPEEPPPQPAVNNRPSASTPSTAAHRARFAVFAMGLRRFTNTNPKTPNPESGSQLIMPETM